MLLLVNPVIHDFAAYDFWAKPLGLLHVAAVARRLGFDVELLDCLDPCSPWLHASRRPRRRAHGQGCFAREPIARPACVPAIARRYARYGLAPDEIRAALAARERPQAVLVTSAMTYWWPGVRETISLIRKRWPDLPVVLGGIYATLCTDHARTHSLATVVIPGPVEAALDELCRLLGRDAEPTANSLMSGWPCYDLLDENAAVPLLTSRGCPYCCAYCGVHALAPRFAPLPLPEVFALLDHLARRPKLSDLALYDDAFFADPARAIAILQHLGDLNPARTIRLHAASGLACRHLDLPMAQAMFRAGFGTVRLGLETEDAAQQRRLGNKVTCAEFAAAVAALMQAGFAREHLGAYVMVGLPGQTLREVEQSVAFVQKHGMRPYLAEYSPVPASPLFAEAQACSRFDLGEPLMHNPTLLPCASAELDREAIDALRRRCGNPDSAG